MVSQFLLTEERYQKCYSVLIIIISGRPIELRKFSVLVNKNWLYFRKIINRNLNATSKGNDGSETLPYRKFVRIENVQQTVNV